MKKSAKPILVKQISEQLKSAKSVTVIDYQGMPTKTSFELRQKIRAAGGSVLVAKNTLLKLALQNLGFSTQESGLEEGLQGPTAVIFANEDEIAPLQVIGKFIQETGLPKLKFGLLRSNKLGLFNGEFIDSTKLIALSRLPSRNVLIGQLLGALVAPKYAFVQTLNGNLQKLVFILNQRQEILSTKS